MKNQQRPERIVRGEGQALDLHSMFFTIQGEGPFAGHRSIFVRLAGCNLQCPGCDTEYTQGRVMTSPEAIVGQVRALAEVYKAPECLIVITGGEPTRQPIGSLVRLLGEAGHHVQIETNGVFDPDRELGEFIARGKGRWVTVVVSPKTKRINPVMAELATCFKYVLDASSVAEDGLPVMALEHPASTGVARPRAGAPVYLSPFDTGDAERNKLNLKAVADSCLAHGYILGVQLHKLVGLE